MPKASRPVQQVAADDNCLRGMAPPTLGSAPLPPMRGNGAPCPQCHMADCDGWPSYPRPLRIGGSESSSATGGEKP